MEKYTLKYSGEQTDFLLDKVSYDVATKSYVDNKIANLVNSAPETLDTLGEIADAIEENKDVVDALNAAIANKADKSALDSKADKTDLDSKANASHSQAASTITAGTLGGAVVANASAVTAISTKQIRNIYAGTEDLEAGVSALPTGDIYLVYA